MKNPLRMLHENLSHEYHMARVRFRTGETVGERLQRQHPTRFKIARWVFRIVGALVIAFFLWVVLI